MELAGQIKKYRADLELSQEALAEKIYVSRQTISNWETEKSYPDINSLIRMSEIFGITVDELLKGDAEEIKQMIRKEDQNELNRLSIIYGVMMLVMMITPIPLVKFLRFVGVGIWAVIAIATVLLAFMVEKKKKELNLGTYREIAAFLEGKHLDEIESAVEKGKLPYQRILLAIAVCFLALVICVIMWLLLYR